MSNLPGVSGKRQDGGLRLPGPSTDGLHCKIGPSTLGLYNTVYVESNASSLVSDLGAGELVESGAYFLEEVNPGYFIRCNTSVAGSLVVWRTLLGPIAATVTTGVIPGLTQPDEATSVDCFFTAASLWDGGNLTFVGVDPSGAAINYVLTQATIVALGVGAQVFRIPKVFAANGITSVSKAATGANTGTLTVKYGTKKAAGSSASDGTMFVTGTPTARFQVQVVVLTDGDVSTSPPTVNITVDGGNNFYGPIAIPVGGVYALPSTFATGLTINLSGAAIKAGDVYYQETIGPTWNNTDLATAMAAANASQYDFEAMHILGAVDAVAAAVISSYITAAENQNSPKWYFVTADTRDMAVAESETTWINSIAGASPGFLNYADYRVSMCASPCELLDPVTSRINRRGASSAYIRRLMAISVGTAPSETDLGPLDGITLIYHDEDKREALDSQRFTTLRTFGRLQGIYVTQGEMMYPTGSDFQRIQSLRVINKGMRIVYDALLPYVNKKVQVDRTTGAITEDAARSIELPIVTLLRNLLGDDITEPRVQINRSDNMLITRRLRAKVGIIPVAYAEHVDFTIGLLNPALELI